MKQNYLVKILLPAKYIYNNTQNGSIGNVLLELNYMYYLYIFFEDKINLYYESKSASKLIQKQKI